MKNRLLCIVTAVTLLSFPNKNFAQAPTLGTAAGFVLFSSNGAITNTGLSILTGNVGTNSGTSSAFGNVNGVMHDVDAESGQCAADLLIAYTQLNSISPTTTHGIALGNGETLTDGVYFISGNAALNLNLTLDGEGNTGAVFIFQVQGEFSTASSAHVNLINGATACNVFWKVEGLVSLGAGTTMKGTIIANNFAIDIDAGASLEGRAFSTAGAITIDALSANTPIGCGTPLLTGPAAPALASTACYALFSSSGAVINTGDTYVTGDVGTNLGLTTGYNFLNVNGMIHPVPDVSTATCKDDLVNVYNYLNTRPADIELLYPAQFGKSLVLTPHTYILGAATILTDSLYLNADGNVDAVFIIKVTGALSTGTHAKVILINGTQAKNVFWKVEGAVSINDSSVFKGTVIANNGAISLKRGSNLEGRALTTSGAFGTAEMVAAATSFCSVLPVTWLYFRGRSMEKNVLLEWSTSLEKDNSYFTIEKSMDGLRFETLTTIKTFGTNPNAASQYSFTDQQPYNLSFYRISQTDNNGQRNYYRTIRVKADAFQAIQGFTYIAGSYIYLQVSGLQPGNGSLQLYSIDGKKVAAQPIVLIAGTGTYKIGKPLYKGLYQISIESGGKKCYSGKVMVL